VTWSGSPVSSFWSGWSCRWRFEPGSVRPRGHRGYTAIQAIPGVGAILGTVFVAEIGYVHRFPGPGQLSSWAGLTPKHHESDTKVHTRESVGGVNSTPPTFPVHPHVGPVEFTARPLWMPR
jgi:Transposase IS116/IS110/IS902 family